MKSIINAEIKEYRIPMMKSDKSKIKAMPALIAGALFLGCSAILIKSANSPGIVTAFYRMAIGGVVLVIPFLWSLKKGLPDKKGVLFAIAGGVLFGMDMSFWSTGIVISNATLPTLAANMAPLWAGLGAWLIFKEKNSKAFWIGLFIAIVGLFIMVSQDIFQSGNIVKGIAYGLIAGMMYGGYYLVTQKGRARISTLHYLSISTITSALFLFLMMIIFRYNFTGYDSKTWNIFFAYGILVQVGGWWLINYSQGHLRAVVVAPTLLAQPVITAIIAHTLLDENLSFYHLLGGSIVVAGIYIIHFTRKK